MARFYTQIIGNKRRPGASTGASSEEGQTILIKTHLGQIRVETRIDGKDEKVFIWRENHFGTNSLPKKQKLLYEGPIDVREGED